MSLFAISDLHLSLGGEKPMDIFGEQWQDHHLRIKENWEKVVKAEDTVILGGDLCWAMKLEEALPELEFIHQLPGRKVLFKGNHDYWWQSYRKVCSVLPESVFAVQNNHFVYENGIAVCGSRGWLIPAGDSAAEHDLKVYNRERMRLGLSLAEAQKNGCDKLIAVLHYPPFMRYEDDMGFADILQQFKVKICVYGHLHGADQQRAFVGEKDGITYYLASSDYLDFTPLPIDLSIF